MSSDAVWRLELGLRSLLSQTSPSLGNGPFVAVVIEESMGWSWIHLYVWKREAE